MALVRKIAGGDTITVIGSGKLIYRKRRGQQKVVFIPLSDGARMHHEQSVKLDTRRQTQ